MGAFLYQHPTDNRASAMTWSVSTGTVSVDPNYVLTMLTDWLADTVVKITSVGNSIAIDGNAGSVQTGWGLFSVVFHNLPAGCTVVVKLSALSNFSTGVTRTVVVPTAREDGWPVNPVNDLSTETPSTYRYLRLLITGITTGTVLSIGELWVGAVTRTLPYNIDEDTEAPDEERPGGDQASDTGAVRTFDWGITDRRWGGTIGGMTAAQAVSLRSWWRASVNGGRKPFLIVTDAAVNEALLVMFPRLFTMQTKFSGGTGNYSMALAFEEVSGGKPN